MIVARMEGSFTKIGSRALSHDHCSGRNTAISLVRQVHQLKRTEIGDCHERNREGSPIK